MSVTPLVDLVTDQLRFAQRKPSREDCTIDPSHLALCCCNPMCGAGLSKVLGEERGYLGKVRSRNSGSSKRQRPSRRAQSGWVMSVPTAPSTLKRVAER